MWDNGVVMVWFFHCYRKEQFRINGYDVIYMKICTFEIYKKNRTNTSWMFKTPPLPHKALLSVWVSVLIPPNSEAELQTVWIYCTFCTNEHCGCVFCPRSHLWIMRQQPVFVVDQTLDRGGFSLPRSSNLGTEFWKIIIFLFQFVCVWEPCYLHFKEYIPFFWGGRNGI